VALCKRDDLVQTAVMRVMQIVEADASLPNESRTLASSYLYRVVHSALVDEIRRVRRRREESLDTTADQNGTRHSGTQLDPERIAASRQIGRGIQSCLARMQRDRRLAVTLYLQGHTVPEASRILAWSAKRTENLVYRGLSDLRDCLKLQGMRP
jgi:RNA polymerase sigma-70 factor (ECF subfamily)